VRAGVFELPDSNDLDVLVLYAYLTKANSKHFHGSCRPIHSSTTQDTDLSTPALTAHFNNAKQCFFSSPRHGSRKNKTPTDRCVYFPTRRKAPQRRSNARTAYQPTHKNPESNDPTVNSIHAIPDYPWHVQEKENEPQSSCTSFFPVYPPLFFRSRTCLRCGGGVCG
jgi:hypothetical protein